MSEQKTEQANACVDDIDDEGDNEASQQAYREALSQLIDNIAFNMALVQAMPGMKMAALVYVATSYALTLLPQTEGKPSPEDMMRQLLETTIKTVQEAKRLNAAPLH